MFGYVAANQKALSDDEKSRYQAYYCGLCRQLHMKYGSVGRSGLTYDMTFLAILLSSVYGLDETCGSGHCLMHPIRSRPYVITPATSYAADMNMILSYYQSLDDWNDDRNPVAWEKSRLMEKFIPGIREGNPDQYRAITECLRRLGEMERANELNPDLPANCFGELMGALFLWRGDACSDTLWRMGAALGRFIYLMDAACDLKADIKKQRYNPLMTQMEPDLTPILTMIIAECTAEFEKLPTGRDRRILQNHLYSGVWQKYLRRESQGSEGAEV
jgi:hypothetical protein